MFECNPSFWQLSNDLPTASTIIAFDWLLEQYYFSTAHKLKALFRFEFVMIMQKYSFFSGKMSIQKHRNLHLKLFFLVPCHMAIINYWFLLILRSYAEFGKTSHRRLCRRLISSSWCFYKKGAFETATAWWQQGLLLIWNEWKSAA